ncbi:unnamed protein product [Prunus armeniaca]
MKFLSSSSSCAKLADLLHKATQNSSAIALSSPQLEELEKKIAELNSMLSAELAYRETKVFELKRNMSLLKSSLVLKDGEIHSSAFVIQERKEAYFHLKHKDFEAIVDGYKLGYLDCKSGVAPCHPIEDEDVEVLCPEMPLALDKQINDVNRKDVEELVVDELAFYEDDTKEGAVGEVAVEVMQQVAGATEHTTATNEQVMEHDGAMEGVADQTETKEATD